jgi:hypothetical protein
MKRLSAPHLPGTPADTPECSFATVALVSASGAGSLAPSAFAHIPFDFLVGKKVLAAGPYSVEPSGLTGMLVVRRADGDSQPILVQAICVPGKMSATVPKLLFYCQRERYFLAQVLTQAIRRPRTAPVTSDDFPEERQPRLEKLRSCLR